MGPWRDKVISQKYECTIIYIVIFVYVHVGIKIVHFYTLTTCNN